MCIAPLYCAMALLKFFSKSSSSLPSAKDTGIGEAATKEANAAVSRVLSEKQPQQSSSVPADRPKVKRKYTSFSAEQRASIGRYAAEHSNSAAVKKFKSDFEKGLGESTVRLFKKRYIEELNKCVIEISAIQNYALVQQLAFFAFVCCTHLFLALRYMVYGTMHNNNTK